MLNSLLFLCLAQTSTCHVSQGILIFPFGGCKRSSLIWRTRDIHMTHVGHNIQASTLPHTSRWPNAADIEEPPPQQQSNHFSGNSNGSSNSNSNDYANDSSNTNHCKLCTDLPNDVTIINIMQILPNYNYYSSPSPAMRKLNHVGFL